MTAGRQGRQPFRCGQGGREGRDDVRIVFPALEGGGVAPCSKYSLAGVECVAGEARPFEVCVCVKIAVALQVCVD